MRTLPTVHHGPAAQRTRCSGNPRSPDDVSPTRQPDRPTMSTSIARLTIRALVCVVVLASCGHPQADGAGVVDETSLSSVSLPATRAGARRAIASPRGRRPIAHRWGAAASSATCWSCWVGELFAEEELCPTSGWVETARVCVRRQPRFQSLVHGDLRLNSHVCFGLGDGGLRYGAAVIRLLP
jgi:hypothetical protein